MRTYLNSFVSLLLAIRLNCPRVSRSQCCNVRWTIECVPPHCVNYVLKNCPERKMFLFRRTMSRDHEIRRAPPPKCGTAETKYEPCTSRTTADKLFLACCELYVPPECHSLCTYETNQTRSRAMLTDIIERSSCNLNYLSGILFCASQNRDNRQCCSDLEINAPQLQVGSRCLRMCDPSGTEIERITRDDATCLFNWNVIMYCHHSGIREM
ncbi:unnamed protein product [Enterobius vermicularis]|uniref:DB domain-containing protein n=1 Tax=Enterobius vermicularis TaxID=51028 RepID=A0A0N4VER5_ENTVE|nr:unnamed protein product [Enterobius vermicularis]